MGERQHLSWRGISMGINNQQEGSEPLIVTDDDPYPLLVGSARWSARALCYRRARVNMAPTRPPDSAGSFWKGGLDARLWAEGTDSSWQ